MSHQKLTSAMELVEAVEQYQAASDMLPPTRKEPVASVPARSKLPHPNGPNPASSQPRLPPPVDRRPAQPWGIPNPESRRCFRCGELGHIHRSPLAAPMYILLLSWGRVMLFPYCSLLLPYLSYCVVVWGNTYATNIEPLPFQAAPPSLEPNQALPRALVAPDLRLISIFKSLW